MVNPIPGMRGPETKCLKIILLEYVKSKCKIFETTLYPGAAMNPPEIFQSPSLKNKYLLIR